MVTQDNNKDIAKAIKEASSTWDLVTMHKRDPWLIKITSLVSKNPKVKAALENGPPTAAMLKKIDPSMTNTRAMTAAAILLAEYDDLNNQGYDMLFPTIDFSKRPAVASRITLKIADRRDGHALWMLIQEFISYDTTEKQTSLRNEFDNFKLSSPVPSPDELEDDLYSLQGVWLRLLTSDESKPASLIQQASSILPSGPGLPDELKAFAGTIRALLGMSTIALGAAHGVVGQTIPYDNYVKLVVEQYRGIINAAHKNGTSLESMQTSCTTIDGAALGLVDGRPPPAAGERRPRTPRESKPRNKCDLCNVSLCKNVGGNKSGCGCFNFLIEVNDGSKGQQAMLHSCRAYIAEHPAVTTIKKIRVPYMSTEKAIKIYKNARGTSAPMVPSGLEVDDGFWAAIEDFDSSHAVLALIDGEEAVSGVSGTDDVAVEVTSHPSLDIKNEAEKREATTAMTEAMYEELLEYRAFAFFPTAAQGLRRRAPRYGLR